jgi:hypothetical protein
VAAAVELAQTTLNYAEDDAALSRALQLVAESQSALRIAAAAVGEPKEYDQMLAFLWLKRTAEERQIYIHRHMRLNDEADSFEWDTRLERIRHTIAALHESYKQSHQRGSLLDTLAYHATQLKLGQSSDPAYAWRKIVEAADESVETGMAPSSLKIRELLLPILDDMPETIETTRNFYLILRELDGYLAAKEAAEPELEDANAITEEVRRVSRLLQGRAVVLVGGDSRPHAKRNLEKSFQLRELIWVDTRSHQSHTICEPHIARPDVAIVLLAIRWASHNLGNIREYCDRYGKPLVSLPRGYNPNQVARQILDQAGDRLGRMLD